MTQFHSITGIIITLLVAANLRAQVFMRPFDNAALLAAGGASVALPTTSSGWTNPAQLGNAAKIGVHTWSALPYGLTDWRSVGAQAQVQAGSNAGFGVSVLHSGIPAYAEQRFQLDYGRKLGKNISIGGSFSALRVSANEYGSGNAVSFGVGVLAQPFKRLNIAAVISNPASPDISGSVIPANIRLGLAWNSSGAVSTSLELEKDIDRPAQIKGGMIYRPHPMIYLRAGARTQPARAAFGAGLLLKNGLALDFGSEWHSVLGLTPALMLSWTKP